MDHRSYQSIVPTHNKLLQKRWDQQRFSTHRGKVGAPVGCGDPIPVVNGLIQVRSASCIVDTRAPKAHMHVQMKMKKQQVVKAEIQREKKSSKLTICCLQLEEERLAVIERDNRMLLEKMSHIMRSRGRVDDRNVYEHKRLVLGLPCGICSVPEYCSRISCLCFLSLNKEKRERELLRVAEENKVRTKIMVDIVFHFN